MTMRKLVGLMALVAMMGMAMPASAASEDLDRDRSTIGKMFNKLGRGITNVLTCWVEIPRTIAREWERTDPATGVVLGSVKGIGWGFTRFVTGAYETVTFPFPVPPDYAPMMEPEFVVTDTWGDGVPGFTDMYSNEPDNMNTGSTYPGQFR